MAELLVKMEPMPFTLDPKFTWGRGHVVCVFPDGWEYGDLECPPKFCVIQVTDMTVEEARTAYAQKDFIVGPDGIATEKGLRQWKFDFDDPTMAANQKKLKDDIGASDNKNKKVKAKKVDIDKYMKRLVNG